MPSFEHHGTRIYYEEFGHGFPILTFAPAGLQSVIDVWSQPSAPINPTTEWAANYRVIAMDSATPAASPAPRLPRRTAGTASPPITSRCSTTFASIAAISTVSASAGRLSST
jgi:hypothetical protein